MSERVENDRLSGVLTDHLAAIAEEASRLILPYWRNGVQAMTKADASPVTEADQKAEVLIDPLDGTKGFIAGKEHFTVNIALVERGRVVAGVVSAPALAVTWTGIVGQGARRRRFGQDWQDIRVRTRGERAHALLSHSMKDQAACDLAGQHGCLDWTGMDSSIKFCLIAQGDYDGYPRSGPTSEWDTAAGQAVLEAAGGRVLAPDGQPLAYGKPRFLNGPFVAQGG